MAHGSANALDTTLCRELAAQLAGLERSGHRAAVLTAQGPIFSAGVDLLRLRDGGLGYLEEFLPALSEAFLAVFNCPVPVVAAVNGHAVAGGCILVCACDYRVMNVDHGRIGVTESLVGLPFPVTALEILRFAVGTHRLQELTHFGRTHPAAEAVGLGLIDEAVAGVSVLARAVAIADQFAALAPEPLRHTRRQIRGPCWTASPNNAPPTIWCTGCGTRRRPAKPSRSRCGRRCGTDMPPYPARRQPGRTARPRSGTPGTKQTQRPPACPTQAPRRLVSTSSDRTAVPGPVTETGATHLRVLEPEARWAARPMTVRPVMRWCCRAASSTPQSVPTSPQRHAEPRAAMPMLTSPGRDVPHSEAGSRGRAADKRSRGPTAVLAIRPLTCTSW